MLIGVIVGSLVVAAILLVCCICFCRFDQKSDSSEYYNRSHISKNLYSYEDAKVFIEKREDTMENMNPQQAAAKERYDRIKRSVIEKKVVASSNADNRKSNINVSNDRLLQVRQSFFQSSPPQQPIEISSNDNVPKMDTEKSTDTLPKVTFSEGFDLEKQKTIRIDDGKKNNIQVRGRATLRSSIAHNMGSLAVKFNNMAQRQSLSRYTEYKCFICNKYYRVGDTIFWSPNDNCPHSFHSRCMMRWLLKSNECPLCQNDYLLDLGAEDTP